MKQNTRLGIALMSAAVFIFSLQDALSKHLAAQYNPLMVVMTRCRMFAGFVVILAMRRPGSLGPGSATRPFRRPLAQAALLIAEICVIATADTRIGLIETQAVFAVCPLLIAALSGPVLGERVGLARWLVIGAGPVGVLVILRPGSGVFSPAALPLLASAAMFALCSRLARRAMQAEDALLSLFWSGVPGAGLVTVIGLPPWEARSPTDRGWMALCGGAVLAKMLARPTAKARPVA